MKHKIRHKAKSKPNTIVLCLDSVLDTHVFGQLNPKLNTKLNTTHKTKRVSTDGPGDSGQLGPSIKQIQTAQKRVSSKLNLKQNSMQSSIQN